MCLSSLGVNVIYGYTTSSKRSEHSISLDRKFHLSRHEVFFAQGPRTLNFMSKV